MNKQTAARLEAKYAKAEAVGTKREMEVLGRGGRTRALGASGKPKNLRKTIKRLIGYLSEEKKLIVVAITCTLVHNATVLAAAYMLRPIINAFIYYEPSDTRLTTRIIGLAWSIVAMAGVYAVSIVTNWLQQRIMLSASQHALRRMRRELFDRLQTLPIRYFDTHPTGDVMSRFANDVDTVGEMLNTTLIQIISGCISIIGTVVLMLYTDLLLGGITVIMTPLLAYASQLILKKGRQAYKDQQKCLGIVNGFAEETISGQKVVKVFNHEKSAMEEFEYHNQKLCDAQIRAQFRAGIMGPVTHQMCNMCYAVTACVGGILVASHGFDIGGLAISLNYTRKFNRPINEISMQINTIFAALAGAERVFEVMDQAPEPLDLDCVKPDAITGNIEINNLSFGYTPEITVLHNITLHAESGQKIAFVGSTGAGKTTVTNLLSRFYETDSGAIRIDGIPIERIERSFLRSNIAMVLQDTHLFTGTVFENIRYGRLDATDGEIIEAAKAASAHSFIMQLENGYDTVLENDGANLSQGQRQLLNIARAAVSHAPILILDEATSSVDTRTERLIDQGMDALMKNRTTFVIAHRLSTVRKADAIMVLENGRIIERGTHNQLVSAGGRYADLYHEKSELK